MILSSPSPLSLIKGTLLAKIHQKELIIKEIQNVPLNLFNEYISIDADSIDLDTVLRNYQAYFHNNLFWLKDKKSSPLYNRIHYALRHASSEKFTIIKLALEESFDNGLDFCLLNTSQAARKLHSLAKDVFHEIHRMLGFIRFKIVDEETLVANPLLEHDTKDIILKKFQPRYPHYTLIFIFDNEALVLKAGKITKTDAQPYQALLQKKDIFTKVWQTYYQSQYIDSRKNIPLAQKAIPQKYWNWLEEGKILIEEKKKK